MCVCVFNRLLRLRSHVPHVPHTYNIRVHIPTELLWLLIHTHTHTCSLAATRNICQYYESVIITIACVVCILSMFEYMLPVAAVAVSTSLAPLVIYRELPTLPRLRYYNIRL